VTTTLRLPAPYRLTHGKHNPMGTSAPSWKSRSAVFASGDPRPAWPLADGTANKRFKYYCSN
jgi:hypothetical protein